MIVLVTSVSYGGISQFTDQIRNSLMKLGESVIVYAPSNSELKNVEKYEIGKNFIFKTINSRKLAKKINKIKNVEFVFFMDDTIFSSNLFKHVKHMRNLCVHDPKNHSYNINLKRNLRIMLLSQRRKKNIDISEFITVLSKNSYNEILLMNKNYKSKLILMPLGAHIPNDNIEKINNFTTDKYILFFGNIAKYKNIPLLLQIFESYENKNNIKLVIAGSGALTKEERSKIRNDNNILLYNRYISNGEMKFLFSNKNFLGTIMPYSDATQSGVLAMTYYYKKPVIVSDVLGLTEFVNNKITGFICKNINEYHDALDCIIDSQLGINSYNYYKENLDFDSNLKKILKFIRRKRENK